MQKSNPSLLASEDPITSPEPCAPVDTPQAARLIKQPNTSVTRQTTETGGGKKNSRSRKPKWVDRRVFPEPEYLVPYKLAKYSKGKNPEDSGEPEMWLQLALESGLAKMGSLMDNEPGQWLEPLDGRVSPRESRQTLEDLLRKGTIDAIQKLNELQRK